MRLLIGLLVLIVTPLAWASPARASADFGCSPSWKLVHPTLTGCDNMALLAPGNDTRVNLLLLLMDRHGTAGIPQPKSPEPLFEWRTMRDQLYPRPESDDGSYAEGEGSRCRSNASGTTAFNEALEKARKVADAERAILIEARGAILPNCTGAAVVGADKVAEAAARVKSSLGKAFARYLEGALAFYDGDYDAAASHFSALRSASDPWLKETARYMLGRVEVNRAQFDALTDYGSLDLEKVDQKGVDAAEAALLAYVRDYPRGRYAGSARGLLRRVYWLGSRTAKLAAQYAALFAMDPAERGISWADLAEEIDTKLLPTLSARDTSDPVLLGMIDLMQLRSGAGETPTIDGAELESQRARIGRDAALFDYLRAVHAFYIAKDPAGVLRLIPEAAPGPEMNYLEFSRQLLRRLALERLSQAPPSNPWLALLPGARLPYQRPLLELATAYSYERSRTPGRIFEPRSPVQIPVLRATILAYSADASLLRQRARDASASKRERDFALFVLLYKELGRGAYRDFLADLALVPAEATTQGNFWGLVESEEPVPLGLFTQDQGLDDFDCPPVKTTAATLAARPADARARLCLGEFVRVYGFDDIPLDSPPSADQLGGAPSLFPGRPFSRLEIYKAIIADPRAAAPDKAYALYRAVRCYAPVGHNSCGGTDVPLDQRKAWFQRLKKDFASSPWAQDLKYYW
jgi:hypothetical protein